MTRTRLSDDQRKLIDGWQRGLPLVERPYAAMAAAIGTSEQHVLDMLRDLRTRAVLSRVGAVVRPNTIGASLLAAMHVAPHEIENVAAIVSREPAVNHNYEREHAFNLWFVATAADAGELAGALDRLRAATGHDILELPMERAYYLDLGFPIDLSGKTAANEQASVPSTFPIDAHDRALLAALEDGLPIDERPYDSLGQRCGLDEAAVLRRLQRLIAGGIITRFGLVVRHRALGIDANAMAVWDIDDAVVDDIGQAFAAVPYVTLCYRRPRRRPDWPYNLFTMVHGRDRATVSAQVDALARQAGVEPDRRATLFSRRCFVQRGASYKAA